MSNSIPKQKLVISKVRSILQNEPAVELMFVLGSVSKGDLSSLSDIDMWLVLVNETALNSFANMDEIKKIFAKTGSILGIYRTTAHHFFVTYRNGMQIDLNLISEATYHNIQKMPKYALKYDSKPSFRVKSKYKPEKDKASVENLLLTGYTTLARGCSKYNNKNYFLTLKFIDTVRQSSILPLIPFFEKQFILNSINLNLKSLSKPVQQLLTNTYGKPIQDECNKALLSSKQLLDLFATKAKITKFSKISKDISNSIKPK